MKYWVLLAWALPTIAAATPLDLVCRGTITSTEQVAAETSVRQDGKWTTATTTMDQRVQSDGTVRVQLAEDGAQGRVRLPRGLTPMVSRGKEGWWDLMKLRVTDDAIRGELSLNWLNKPKLVIDRRTGDIDMRLLGGSFAGICERAPDVDERKF